MREPKRQNKQRSNHIVILTAERANNVKRGMSIIRLGLMIYTTRLARYCMSTMSHSQVSDRRGLG